MRSTGCQLLPPRIRTRDAVRSACRGGVNGHAFTACSIRRCVDASSGRTMSRLRVRRTPDHCPTICSRREIRWALGHRCRGCAGQWCCRCRRRRRVVRRNRRGAAVGDDSPRRRCTNFLLIPGRHPGSSRSTRATWRRRRLIRSARWQAGVPFFVAARIHLPRSTAARPLLECAVSGAVAHGLSSRVSCGT